MVLASVLMPKGGAWIQLILFTNQPATVPQTIVEYLKSLKPVLSPYLIRGKLSPAARDGRQLFAQAGCVNCHVPGLFTDLRPHDVGTRVVYDRPTDKFYTPTLIEAWRTAPYLHNGSAATIRDVITKCSSQSGLHGDAEGLTDRQIDDLCSYVLSL